MSAGGGGVRDTSPELDESRYFGLEKHNDQLKEQLKTLTRTCEATLMENAMLADYLTRICQNQSVEEMEKNYEKHLKQTSKNKKSGGKAAQDNMPEVLQYDMKFYIASSEVDSLIKDIEATKRTAQKNVELLKALMEETEIRTQELKRESYELRRDVVVGAENSRDGSTMAEPLLRWLEEKLTKKDALASKLLMKNHALKAAIRKVRQQLRAKDDSGEDLAYIDFHQMQIENQQFVAKIEETTAELIALKRTASHTTARLTQLKEELASEEEKSVKLADELKDKGKKLAQLRNDRVQAEHEAALVKKDSEDFARKTQTDAGGQTIGLPNIHACVQAQQQEIQLSDAVRNMDRKLSIALNAWKTMKSRVKEVQRQDEARGVFDEEKYASEYEVFLRAKKEEAKQLAEAAERLEREKKKALRDGRVRANLTGTLETIM